MARHELSQGLRAAAGVFSPRIDQLNRAERLQKEQIASNRQNQAQQNARADRNFVIKTQLTGLANQMKLIQDSAARTSNPAERQALAQQAQQLTAQKDAVLQQLVSSQDIGTETGTPELFSQQPQVQQGVPQVQPEQVQQEQVQPEQFNQQQAQQQPQQQEPFLALPEQQGEIIRGTDINPNAPEDLFLIRNPNGNLTAIRQKADGSKEAIKFTRQETDDGRVAVFAQEPGKQPEFAGYLKDEAGNDLKTGVSSRAQASVDAAADRSKGVNDRFNRGLAERAKKNRVSVENQASDDYRQDFAGIKKIEAGLNTLDSLLAVKDPTALDSKAIQNTLSNILNTSVRAQAELESFKTFGNLGQRIEQMVTRFIEGGFTEQSLVQVRAVSERMRQQVVDPSKAELAAFYRARVVDQGGNPDNVVRRSDKPEFSMDENGNFVRVN